MSNHSITDILQHRPFRLGSKPDPQTGRPSVLNIKPNHFNNVAISCRAGDGYINVSLSIDEFGSLLERIIEVATKKRTKWVTEVNKQGVFDAAIAIGRDDDGAVYLSIGNKEGKQQRFEFMPNLKFVHKVDGNPASPDDITSSRAKWWARNVGELIQQAWRENFIPAESNGGGNRPQQSGYQQSSYQQSAPAAAPAPAEGSFQDLEL